MLTKDPEKRMAIDELIYHDWVTNEGKENFTEQDLKDLQLCDTNGFGNFGRQLSMNKFVSQKYKKATSLTKEPSMPGFKR